LSKQPSRGLRWLYAIGRIHQVLPELYATCSIPQEQEWHPEGNVFEHSMQTLDAATRTIYDSNYYNLVLRFAGLCHDLGKVSTTRTIAGRIRSLGHEQAGIEPTRNMLNRICLKKDLINDVTQLVRHHMAPMLFVKQKAGLAAYKRLALMLTPRMNISILAELSYADHCGRNPANHIPLIIARTNVDTFLQNAERANVTHNPESALLSGCDLLDIVPSGKDLGLLLKWAYTLQINKGINDKQKLRQAVINKIKNKKQ